MIKAVSAVAYNVALLAQNFNEKLMSLDEDVKRSVLILCILVIDCQFFD